MRQFTESETQLITSLSWFRTRYALFLNLDLNRKASRENIEDFGKIWIGNFKSDWSKSFDDLVTKEVLEFVNGEYTFTPKGELIKQEIESQTPFYQYEYDQFFDTEKLSLAHSKFCKKVYGIDLSQHGLIDQKELSILIEKLNLQQPENVLDIGCGNGKITEYLSHNTSSNFTGVDISREGIKSAKERTKDNKLLHFEQGNMNHLKLNTSFDGILFLDTLYYADDLQKTIEFGMDNLNLNGRLYAYFSQWIMDVSYADNLKPHNTHLAKVLNAMGFEYNFIDLTKSGIEHWKNKLSALEELKMDFINEGQLALWEYRHREANRYANWGDDKYSRYFYEVKK